MSVVVIGLSHRSAPVELRERFAFVETEVPGALQQLRDAGIVTEGVVLSTCNRVEIYAATELTPDRAFADLKKFLIAHHAYDRALGEELYALAEPESLAHLFKVAAGLDSMVIGETEIFGQLKKAYDLASHAAESERQAAPLLDWNAGLSAFRLGQFGDQLRRRRERQTQRREVAIAFERLNKVKIGLLEAVDFAVKHMRPEGGDRSVKQVVDEMIAMKKAWLDAKEIRERSYKDFRLRALKFEDAFGSELAKNLTLDEIKTWLKEFGLSGRSTKNYRMVASEIMKYAAQKKYRADNNPEVIKNRTQGKNKKSLKKLSDLAKKI